MRSFSKNSQRHSSIFNNGAPFFTQLVLGNSMPPKVDDDQYLHVWSLLRSSEENIETHVRPGIRLPPRPTVVIFLRCGQSEMKNANSVSSLRIEPLTLDNDGRVQKDEDDIMIWLTLNGALYNCD